LRNHSSSEKKGRDLFRSVREKKKRKERRERKEEESEGTPETLDSKWDVDSTKFRRIRRCSGNQKGIPPDGGPPFTSRGSAGNGRASIPKQKQEKGGWDAGTQKKEGKPKSRRGRS